MLSAKMSGASLFPASHAMTYHSGSVDHRCQVRPAESAGRTSAPATLGSPFGNVRGGSGSSAQIGAKPSTGAVDVTGTVVVAVVEDEITGRPGDVDSALAGGAVGTDGPAGVRSVESERTSTTATSAAAVAAAIA